MAAGKVKFCGFSIGGVDWLEPDLSGTNSPSERAARLTEIGSEEARLTFELGGNLLRVFYSHAPLLSRENVIATGSDALPQGPYELVERLRHSPFYLFSHEEKVRYLTEVNEGLTRQLYQVEATPEDGEGLSFADLDAYLEGVSQFNETLAADEKAGEVRILLTRVQLPPVPLLECPNKAVLGFFGVDWSFDTMFARYNAIHAAISRRLAFRYAHAKPFGKIICAHEINNEPDYEWLPDELRIEHSKRSSASPINKYVTELHHSQIPQWSDPNPPHEPTPWDGFMDQDGAWLDAMSPSQTAIIDYDFGIKFKWYVRCYAETARHTAYALYSQTRDADCEIVSAGVTHCNVHFLIEMYRQDPGVFDHCTAIGLHPYHWPKHDIYDKNFWSPTDYTLWENASPRDYARNYFKHFDFFREVFALTKKDGPQSFGMSGKKIWLTEFGIPTKLKGTYNSAHSAFVPFIRPAETSEEVFSDEGLQSAEWEGIWNGFFDSVTPEMLGDHGVEALAVYTLRETGIPKFDKHDDDRSNFSLVRRNGKPRLEAATFDRFRTFFCDATGTSRDRAAEFRVMPAWGRSKTFSSALLLSHPWHGIKPPETVEACLSMMTRDEKKLLFWSTSEYFSNQGEVVEAGAFVGGSTVSLASGLMTTWPDVDRQLHTYDMFRTDDFMEDFYFRPNGLQTIDSSFRGVFETNIESVSSRVNVNAGDITTFHWDRGPIEILFIDVCKVWEVDDHVVKEFFPHLIPGQSLVIQQDFFHHWCPWLIVTMELFHEELEYVGFAKWNTGVFRCVKPLDMSKRPLRLQDMPFEEMDMLIERHAGRYENDYQKGVLLAARAVLNRYYGRSDACAAILVDLRARFGSHPELANVLTQIESSAE